MLCAAGLERSDTAQRALQQLTDLPATPDALSISLSSSIQEAHSYRMLLFEPSPHHVASLCVQQSLAAGAGSSSGGISSSVRVKMWQCVPLVGQSPMDAGARAIACN
jgi:hypothetical protein